jgi:hypothetical protein
MKLHYSTRQHYTQQSHTHTTYELRFEVKLFTCVFNALLEAAGHLPQVQHDLGVALLSQPQKLNTTTRAMSHTNHD